MNNWTIYTRYVGPTYIGPRPNYEVATRGWEAWSGIHAYDSLEKAIETWQNIFNTPHKAEWRMKNYQVKFVSDEGDEIPAELML